ncbi:MAG TPA: hypothetical protein VMS04_20420 [Vicinamibacterales bacterium]|nr:hypothetical protein [Vicinamibacterales bacterium]
MSDSLTAPALPDAPGPTDPSAPAEGDQTAGLSPAVAKFKSCRWRRPPEDGPECCGHRDVLPIAGTSFNPEAWCPDCTFFKLRRTPKKRPPDEYRY